MKGDPQSAMPTTFLSYARRFLATAVLATGAAVLARGSYARHLRQGTVAGPGSTITVDDGIQLHTDVEDHADARLTIVFVHGFAASSQEFHEQRAALRGAARLVLFDHRGHGSSGWGRYRRATIDQLGHDLGQVIDAQPATIPIVLVSHSMGGMATLALAKQRPELFTERIAAVALLSTAAGRLPATNMPRQTAQAMVRTHLATVAAWALWLTAPLIDVIAPFRRQWGQRWLLHKLFGEQGPPEKAAGMVEDMWIGTPMSMASAFYPAFVSYNVPAALDVLDDIPVLVLAGTNDRVIPSERSENLAQQIDSAELVLVEGAGHMVNLTHPGKVNEALRELVDRARP